MSNRPDAPGCRRGTAGRPGGDVHRRRRELRQTIADRRRVVDLLIEAKRWDAEEKGPEKWLARYPQLYSRVGFVHEFKPLSREEVRQLLQDRWWPAHAPLPEGGIADEDRIAAIIRITGGNLRLLHPLLTQIGRILEINKLEQVISPVVDATRESPVIRTA